eukprot:gene5562-6747_t
MQPRGSLSDGFKSYDNPLGNEDPLGPDDIGIDLAGMNNAKKVQGQEKAAPRKPPSSSDDDSSSDEDAAIPTPIKQQIQAQSAANLRNAYANQRDAPPPATRAKPLDAYTVNDVCEFVKKLGLPSAAFEHNEVNGLLLSELTMEDLANDLQLKGLHAKRLMRALDDQYPDRLSS